MNVTKRKYTNCNSCNERDDFDDMVRCDHCRKWYHYYCAGVSQPIKDLDWVCQVCLKKFSETYQSAKAAEDSIIRNLEMTKRSKNDALRVDSGSKNAALRVDNDRSVAVNLETERIKELISEKIEYEFAQRFGTSISSEPILDVEKLISKKIEDTLVRRFEGFQLHDGTEGSYQNKESAYGESEVEAGGDDEGACGGDDVGARGSDRSSGRSVEEGKENVGVVLPVKCDSVEESEKILLQLNIELVEKWNDLLQANRKKGAKKLSTTMTNISNKLIDDSVLKFYSYKGAGKGDDKKKPFEVYGNITNFIVQTSVVAYNEFNDDVKGFEKITEKDAFMHFKTSHLKYAKQRTGKK